MLIYYIRRMLSMWVSFYFYLFASIVGGAKVFLKRKTECLSPLMWLTHYISDFMTHFSILASVSKNNQCTTASVWVKLWIIYHCLGTECIHWLHLSNYTKYFLSDTNLHQKYFQTTSVQNQTKNLLHFYSNVQIYPKSKTLNTIKINVSEHLHRR